MQFKLLPLRTAIAFITTLAILSTATVTAGNANETLDMSQLTCAEFDELGKMEKMMSLMWLSGWMAQQQGNFDFTPDRGVMSERGEALEAACENHEEDLVMNRLVEPSANN